MKTRRCRNIVPATLPRPDQELIYRAPKTDEKPVILDLRTGLPIRETLDLEME